MYSQGLIREYLDDAASGKPAPGGGSVSAMVGSLGATMACMAANFTVGKEKFRSVQPECRAILERCQASCRKLLEFVDADVQAYSHVSKAYGMPRETAEQKAARTAAIQEALRVAMAAPLGALRVCAAVVDDLARLVDIANPNLISDVGVAALHVYAGLRGCKLNVEINLASVKDQEFVRKHQDEIDAADARAKQIADDVLAKVYKAIRK
ncbi:MAG TPA: cyclodeaminase/cyclohydrolase family protein [Planctomycetota bacterium]|nr:cyclodeaminase/cyclohydrolase family protein [Planctomycetota bacterium]